MEDILVRRGGIVESTHRVHVAVVNSAGEMIAKVGDPEKIVFCRSAAKPFQAVPLIEENVIDQFGISSRELAVMCASHSGEPKHVAAVKSILAKIGLSEEDLECGPHPPFEENAAIDLYAKGQKFTALHNNCSGKHAGMLALALSKGWKTGGYIKQEHPVQIRMISEISRWTGLDKSGIQLGIDGCGVVCFGLPLSRLAQAFCKLGGAEDSNQRIVSSMVAHPDMVAGTGRFGTALVEVLGGRIFAKTGAEGVFAVGCTKGEFGIAIKVEDGTKRATPLVVIQILEHFNLLKGTNKESLSAFSSPMIRNTLGEVVGAIGSNFDLVCL